MRNIFAILLTLCALVAACGHDERRDVAVPKPYAYPRFMAMDTVRHRVNIGTVSTEINSSATFRSAGDSKADIIYAPYGLTLHTASLEESTPEGVKRQLENRNTRFGLNTSGYGVKNESFTAGGFESKIIISPEAPTPLQFVSWSKDGRIFSGAAIFAKEAPLDSIRPIVDAVHQDLLHMLLSLD